MLVTLHAAKTVWVYDDDDEEEEISNEEGEAGDENSHKARPANDEEVVDDDGASSWEGEDSDAETVTARKATNRSSRKGRAASAH